ncbi:GH25 family lysozyme [Rhizobium ruizarguesonis]|uniref:GH25 family lysozyme n=1 Tax=Rhizobium ruizarguesonis TaxID=2081791 RepID=UPI0013D02FB6|nr:GH25 family lysozyme [Rhizobium ruizarguesonis]NEH76852.1 hypothetical protein [Rhizobium ruizarguesonis]
MVLFPPSVRRLIYAVIWGAIGLAALPAAACDNGPDVDDEKCHLFAHYAQDGSVAVDENISSRITSDDTTAPSIRSFALIISINKYPNFNRPEDRVLEPARHDKENLVKFFGEQKFDEIIVLENEDATKDNIDYFLSDYLINQSKARGGRTRIVFAYSGHGAPGPSEHSPGSLVLSAARTGSDRTNTIRLNELAPVLKNLASESYHFLALLGSCYSGGIFGGVGDTLGQNQFFARARGGHALSATAADDLAYGLSNSQGSLFFNSLMEGVNSGWADPTYAGIISFQDGKVQVVGGGIARLGAVTGYISSKLELTPNPVTKKPFPQLESGSLYADTRGAFFFLVPKIGGQVINAGLEVSLNDTTGSAIENRPDIKVFSAPDSYSILGVDVSHHSGDIPWKNFKEAGLTFAFMKATEGGTFVDPKFKANWAAARHAELDVGAYHVVNFCKDAKTQFDNIKRVVPIDQSALPIVIDLEWYDNGPGIPSQQGCNNVAKVRTMLHALGEQIAERFGKRPVMYAHEAGIRDLLSDQFNEYPLWLQDWTKDGSKSASGPSLSGNNPWTLWQYAGNTDFAGAKNVDVNAFFGTREQYDQFSHAGENVALQVATEAVPLKK